MKRPGETPRTLGTVSSSGGDAPTDHGWTGVLSLGLLTITAFGVWFYAFGVLIDPINADTGWSTTALGLTYGGAQVLTGLLAFVGGRLLDRFDAPAPFGVHAIGGALLILASTASSIWLFGITFAIGGGIIGGTGFYSITTAAAARLRPDRPDQAIARLTIIGAFCSPIYLPLTAWLVTVWDWRAVLRSLSVATIIAALIAAVAARGARSLTATPSSHPIGAMRRSLRQPAVRRMLLAYLIAGLGFASVLVYQVPVMTSAGIGLGAAGAIGGLRGFCQVFGRVGLTGLIGRFGSERLLQVAYGVAAIGVAFLFVGSVPAGIAYALLAGVAIGASSPLQAIHARSVFDEADLGLLMGLQGAAIGVAGGVGPAIGGVLHDITESWTPIVAVAIGCFTLAATLLRARHS